MSSSDPDSRHFLTEKLAGRWIRVSLRTPPYQAGVANVGHLTETKILNGVLVGVGILIAILTSW